MAPKQNTRKTTNRQKKRNTTPSRQNIKEKGALQDEIILVIALAVSILLFLCNFDLIGPVGKIISALIFGLVGLVAYILPVIVFFITAFHISNPGNRRAGRKILSAIVFFVSLSSLIQLLTQGEETGSKSVFEFFTISSEERTGGGFIGGIFAKLLCEIFDKVGAYIILIALMLITVIIITGKAIFTYLAGKGKVALEERKEYQNLKKEQREEIRAELKKDVERGRRPAKTFVIDKTTPSELGSSKKTAEELPVNPKDKSSKKAQTAETDIPMLDFHSLFEDENDGHSPTQKGHETENTGKTLTYEDELRRKFGQASGETDLKEAGSDSTKQDVNPAQKESQSVNNTHVKDIHPAESDTLSISQTDQQKEYIFPSVNLLTPPKGKTAKGGLTEKDLQNTALKLQSTLESFGVHVTITNASIGPAVTRYELQPEQGVRVNEITRLADDIKLNLAASEIRIEAPIPGKAAVGIEVPNKENTVVSFREMIESKEFNQHPSDVAFSVGKDIGGQIVVTDIAKMPHLLIAGATGSGKSVCINTLIMSILYKSKPSDVRMIMIDPKVVELNVYNGIPHLLIPVVTDPKKAAAALNWAVAEMTERYKKFADVGAKDIKSYNDKVSEVAYLNDENYQKLPQIVIIIDELADLMMVSPGEVEDAICRLAQLARAAGLHLVIATQRPSVNVITGLIKANIPSRIAFAVSSQVDSRTIIDGSGAEKLLGKGDMLFFPSGYPKPVRVQGAFISDKEVSAVVDFLKKNNSEGNYSDDIHEKINNARPGEGFLGGGGDSRDEYFAEAGKFIIEKDKASIGMLQRVYKIGFNRAARIMDQLAEAGVVGPEEGTKPRKILMSQEQFEQYLEEN